MRPRETYEVYYKHVRLKDAMLDDYLRLFGSKAASFLFGIYLLDQVGP